MRLTILNVAYPLAPVGPDTVGGAEQVIAALDAALVRAGHESLVVASETSQIRGTLIPTPCWIGPLDDHAHQRAVEHHQDAISRVLRSWPVDVIHLHGVDAHRYLPPPGAPTLLTLHLPPGWYPPDNFPFNPPQDISALRIGEPEPSLSDKSVAAA